MNTNDDLFNLSICLPEAASERLNAVCVSKGIAPEIGAVIMISFCTRLLQEAPLHKGADLMTELDFARALRLHLLQRADQVLAVAEQRLLEARGLQTAFRNRALSAPAKTQVPPAA